MKQKILIATASFGELDSSILDKLQESYECVFNQTGRKLTSEELSNCLLYTSPSPRDRTRSRMPSSA